MRFTLIDRILELTRGERIVAVKAVSRSEEYLDDHFPTYPVLPGVFMLEAMIEAAAWLVRDAQDFAHTVILLRQARNVTYKRFVKPGRILTATVTCRRLADAESEFDGVGRCEEQEAVRARFSLIHTGLNRRPGSQSDEERRLIDAQRARLARLCRP